MVPKRKKLGKRAKNVLRRQCVGGESVTEFQEFQVQCALWLKLGVCKRLIFDCVNLIFLSLDPSVCMPVGLINDYAS